MPKISISDIIARAGSNYPAPFHEPCMDRTGLDLSAAGGLTQFGIKMITLAPGAWSSQRHWHSHEDELVYIISGQPTFVDDNGPQELAPGDVTSHPANDGNGHHMKNDTDSDVVFMVVGGRTPETDHAYYPDIDLDLPANGTATRRYQRKDGNPY